MKRYDQTTEYQERMKELARQKQAIQDEIDTLQSMMSINTPTTRQQVDRETRLKAREQKRREQIEQAEAQYIQHDLEETREAHRRDEALNEREDAINILEALPIPDQPPRPEHVRNIHLEQSYKDYGEWKRANRDDVQNQLLETALDPGVYLYDGQYHFNIEQLNEVTSNVFYERFRHILQTQIANLPADTYIMRYRFRGTTNWRSKVLNRDTLTHMFDTGLMDVAERQRTFALSGDDVAREVLVYGEFIIERRDANVNTNIRQTRRGGADFRYTYVGDDSNIKEYLKRLEIGVDNKQYSCFIYALKVSGKVDDDILNKMNQRCRSRYLLIKHIQLLCDEFGVCSSM